MAEDLQGLDTFRDFDAEVMVSNSRMAGFCRSQKSRCARAFVLGTSARARSEELFEGKEAEVFRHAYWHALMIIDGMPAQWVTDFGEQWEIWPGNSDRRRSLTSRTMPSDAGSVLGSPRRVSIQRPR